MNKEIVDNYISNIEDIVGKTKNVTIQATVKEIKKFEFEDTLVVILNLVDNSGKINGYIVSDRDKQELEIIDSISKDHQYSIRGNILILNDEVINNLFSDYKEIINYIQSDKLLVVQSIKEVDDIHDISKVNYIRLYLQDSGNKNSMSKSNYIEIPINCVKMFHINNISSSIHFYSSQDYIESRDCDTFSLFLYKEKLRKKDIKRLLGNINIYSIEVKFDDGKKYFYNLPFYSKDDTHNLLQVINDMDQSISVYISRDIQFKWR